MIKKLVSIFILTSIMQVNYADRIQGLKNGVEFNFPRILTYTKNWISMSGTYSRFNHQKNTEIAFPWLIAKYGRGDDALTTQTIDLHYRQFLGDELNGFYLSAFTRLGRFKGKVYKKNRQQSTISTSTSKPSAAQPNTEDYSKFRVGIGVGLGVRVFPKNKRMYWGSGLIVGRYLDLEEQKFINDGDTSFAGPFAESSSIIIDLELLKFGYAF